MTDPAPNHKRRAIRVQILNAKGQKVLNGTLWDEIDATRTMTGLMAAGSIARARGSNGKRWLYYLAGEKISTVKPTKEMTEAFRIAGCFTPKGG